MIIRTVPMATAVLVVACCISVGCSDNQETGETVVKRDINTVMEAHVDELMASKGVTGVAIGAQDDGTPCILILIYQVSEELLKRLPDEIEGHPVTTMVTGQIRPMDDGQDD
jgi:hypothetical protein